MAVAKQDVEIALRRCLEEEGYSLSPFRKKGETGTDVLAAKAYERLLIEVIGFKDSRPARSRDFYEVFFRAISRLSLKPTRIVIALPERFESGLTRRAAAYGPAWQRLGRAFPELEVWLVNHDIPSYRRATWAEWLALNQPGKAVAFSELTESADRDAERGQWIETSAASLQRVYSNHEPDYPSAMVRETNPEYIS